MRERFPVQLQSPSGLPHHSLSAILSSPTLFPRTWVYPTTHHPGHCCRNRCAERQMASLSAPSHCRALGAYQGKQSHLRTPHPVAWPLLSPGLMSHSSWPPLCYSSHEEPLETPQPAGGAYHLRDFTSSTPQAGRGSLPFQASTLSIRRAAWSPALTFCAHPSPSTAPTPTRAFRLLLRGTVCPSTPPDYRCFSQHRTCPQAPREVFAFPWAFHVLSLTG